MANISSEFSCLGDTARTEIGLDVALSMHLQTAQLPSITTATVSSSSLPSSPLPNNHLYHTSSVADETTPYGFAFANIAADRSAFELPQVLQSTSLLPQPSQQGLHADYYIPPSSSFIQPSFSSAFAGHQPMVRAQSDGGGIVYQHHHHHRQDLLNPRMYAAAPSPTPSSSDSSSSSSSSPPSIASSVVSSPTSPDFDEALAMSSMMTIVPVIACAACKRSHIKCDSGRPCQNCLKHPSKASTCRDAIPKPRGRPKGGSKAAAEALLMARLQQEQQQQHQQQQQQQQMLLREQQLQFEQQQQYQYQYQYQYQQQPQRQVGGVNPRPRVMSLPQQSRPNLPLLQMQQQTHRYHASPYALPSKSSPTSPAAAEHRAGRYPRRPSLPTWHHPYAVHPNSLGSEVAAVTTQGWNMLVASPTTVSATLPTIPQEMMHSMSASSTMQPLQSFESLYLLRERLPTVGPHSTNVAGVYSSHPASPSPSSPPSFSSSSSSPCLSASASYSTTPVITTMEPCPQQLQQELFHLQTIHSNLRMATTMAPVVKSEPEENAIFPLSMVSPRVEVSATTTGSRSDGTVATMTTVTTGTEA